MIKIDLPTEIIQTRERPETWRVEAICDQTGDVYCAEFWGPSARQHVEEYAAVTSKRPNSARTGRVNTTKS